MFEIMRDLFDKIGQGSFLTGMILSVGRWLSSFDFSLPINILTVGSLSIGIVFYAMKTYHQYLETRKFKREQKNNKKWDS